MNRTIRTLALAGALATLACTGNTCPPDDPFGDHAADSDGPSYVSQVGVLVEYVQLDAPVASKLVRKHATAADATAFRDEVQKLVDEKKSNARVLESGYIVTSPGQRAKIESIHEFIYPTEYDPPSPPQTFGTAANGFGTSGFPVTPGVPTAFEVRNIGHTMEVEPNVDPDGRIVDLNIAPEIVDFVAFTKYGAGLAESVQPLFHVLKLQTNLKIPANGYTLASVQMPRDKNAEEGKVVPDESQRVLVFVRATVIKIRADADEDGETAADNKADGDADEK